MSLITAEPERRLRPTGLFSLTASTTLLLFCLGVHSLREQAHRSYARSYQEEMAADLSRPEPLPLTERVPSAEEQLEPFLRHGLSAHLQDQKGHTTLMHAAAMRWRHLARYAMDEGVDPKAVGRDGGEALTYAARSGDAEIARLLLMRGVPVDGSPSTQAGPLREAVKNGHLEVVELLLRHRARRGMAEALRAARERHGGLDQQVRWGNLLGGYWPALCQRRAVAAQMVRLLSRQQTQLAHGSEL